VLITRNAFKGYVQPQTDNGINTLQFHIKYVNSQNKLGSRGTTGGDINVESAHLPTCHHTSVKALRGYTYLTKSQKNTNIQYYWTHTYFIGIIATSTALLQDLSFLRPVTISPFYMLHGEGLHPPRRIINPRPATPFEPGEAVVLSSPIGLLLQGT